MEPVPYLLQQGLNAVQIALLYALVAVAHVLFHGVARRINLALGGLAVWGAYVAIAAASSELARFGVPPPARLLVGAAAGAAVGALFGSVLTASVRPLLVASPLAILIATLGWGLVLQEGARLAAGSRELWLAPFLADPLRIGGGAMLTRMQFGVWLLGAGALAAALATLRFSRAGRVWQAVSQDAGMAGLLGVDVARVYRLTGLAVGALCGLSGALGGLAYGNASFNGGFLIALKALFVAILGGLGSPAGAVAGAFALAAVESLWSAYFPGDYRDVATFALLTACLVLRPGGLGGGDPRLPRV